ncbi:MFS transporter [Caldanaerobacter sp.]|uniref:MFS transporter n=1 Tax=Caldanaerobacter sp. TaxID=2930036 RepID=UPI003C732780
MEKLRERFTEDNNFNAYFPFIWHGFFIALTMTMIEMNTILPSLISQLTNSPVAFGALYSVMLGAPVAFNWLFGRFQSGFPYRKQFLILGIYIRSLSFIGMAVVTFLLAKTQPLLALLGFYLLIFIFSLSGGFAGIAYTDLIGKLLPSEKRGGFFAIKQFFNGVGSLTGGLMVAWIFKPGALEFPKNYSIAFLIGGIGLFVGVLGYLFMKEPPSTVKKEENIHGLGEYLEKIVSILKKDKEFVKFIVVENLTGFSLMILPFYIVFIKHNFENYMNYLSFFVISQIVGNIFSNFLWAAISKKLGPKSVLRICILLGGTLPIIAILLKPLGLFSYMILFLLIGFIGSGRGIGFDLYFLEIAPDVDRPLYLGIRGSLNLLVAFLPLAGGIFIKYFGFYTTFIMVSVIMYTAFLLSRLNMNFD